MLKRIYYMDRSLEGLPIYYLIDDGFVEEIKVRSCYSAGLSASIIEKILAIITCYEAKNLPAAKNIVLFYIKRSEDKKQIIRDAFYIDKQIANYRTKYLSCILNYFDRIKYIGKLIH